LTNIFSSVKFRLGRYKYVKKNPPISIDTRRRLEEKLAERQFAREMQEFDFDC
jgi:hypothetical protein